MVRPGLHNTEGFSVLTAALKTTHLVKDLHIFEPVLDTKLFFQEIAMLAFMLLESENFLLEFLGDIYIMVRWSDSKNA